MSDTQTLESIKAAAPEGATHYHVGLQLYLRKGAPGYHGRWSRYIPGHTGWAITGKSDEWAEAGVASGEIIALADSSAHPQPVIGVDPAEAREDWTPDPMAESMPFELLEGDDEPAGRKDDSAKPRFDLIPPRAQESMARVLTSGAARYGENNWKKVEPLDQRYLAAAMRHLNALARGEITDPDTGEHHGAHVMCCAAFLVEHYEIQREKKC